jgi:hypothetical protein
LIISEKRYKSLRNLKHHFFKLLESNFSLLIKIILFHYWIPYIILNIFTNTNNSFYFIDRYCSTLILVIHLKCLCKPLFCKNFWSVNGSGYKLWKIYFSAMILIHKLKNAINFILRLWYSIVLFITFQKLIIL